MKSLILAVAAFVAGPALADVMVYKDENVSVQLADTECMKPALAAFLKEVEIEGAKAAQVQFRGKNLAACWGLIPDGVVIVDEAGSGGVLPTASFKRQQGL